MIARILAWLFPRDPDEATLRQMEQDAYDEAERRIEAYRQNLHRHNIEAMKQSARNMTGPEE